MIVSFLTEKEPFVKQIFIVPGLNSLFMTALR